MVSGGYSTVQRISPIKLNASHPTASGPTIGEIVLWEFPLSLSYTPSGAYSVYQLVDWDLDGQRERRPDMEMEREKRERSPPPWRGFPLRFAAPLAKCLRGVANARPVFTARAVSVNGG